MRRLKLFAFCIVYFALYEPKHFLVGRRNSTTCDVVPERQGVVKRIKAACLVVDYLLFVRYTGCSCICTGSVRTAVRI